MTQLVECLFDDPVEKDFLGVHGRETVFESIGGYDAGFSPQLRFSIDVG